MKQIKRKWLYLISTLCLLGACIGLGSVSAKADSIILSVERFSVGGDFIIEPTEVEIQENEKYSSIIPRAIDATGTYQAISKDSSMGYYMQGINGAQCELNIPACVKDILNKKGETIGNNKHTDEKGLYEFDYTKSSGWMYTVNDQYVDGMSSVTAHDGDVVRVMYTLALGADLFGKETSYGGTVYYPVADKSELIRLMAEANTAPEWWNNGGEDFTNAYQTAKKVMAKMNADESTVDSAVTLMQNVKNSLPVADAAGVSMQKASVTLVNGGSENLKYKLIPQYATAKSLAWTSSDPEIASVDDNGLVQAKKAGSAEITLTVDGTYQAVTTVIVKEAATKIELNKTQLTLQLNGAVQQLTYTLYPADSYAKIIWRSSDTDIVSVSQDGVVSANDVGEADVIAMSAADSSIRAVCRVTVTEPPQLKPISKPKSVNYTYNGSTKNGVASGSGYVLSGTVKAVNAGTYTAKATLKDGYAWSDGSTDPVTLKWTIAKAEQTISVKVSSKSYKAKALQKKAAAFSIGASAKGTLSYKIKQTPSGAARYISVDKNGKVILKKNAPAGVYEICVNAAATANYKAASRTVKINVTKDKQTIRVKKKSVTYKKAELKKKSKSYTIGASAKTKISYHLTKAPAKGKNYLSVNSKGKVTVKKGAPAGTYKITLKAAETKAYKAASMTVTVRVK